MLSRTLKRYYDPLRLPLDHPPLPGSTGYRRISFPFPQDGAEEALSSSQDNLPTVPNPLRRRILRYPLQDLRYRPWPSPITQRLGFPLVLALTRVL
jgi:hypothetical protein